MDIVSITSYLIIGTAVWCLLLKTDFFSGYKIFYLFSLFFFGIAPLVQYKNSVSFFGARQLLKNEYLLQNLLIIFLLFGFHFLYKIFHHKFKFKINIELKYKSISNHYFLVISLLFLLNKILVYPVFSLDNFFLRGNFTLLYDNPQALVSVVFMFIFILPLLFCLHLFILWKKNLSVYRFLILLLLLLAGFPTVLSRTVLAVLSVPILFFLVPNLMKKNNFVLVFIVGFFYMFPFLDQFRKVSSLKQLNFNVDFEVFNTAHFDSYYNFALILNDMPIQWGRQLLGVLFFFIPRDMWVDKPLGSGALMAQKLNMTFDNLSANYFAEGFINFGYIGILFFLVLVSVLTAILDKLGHKVYTHQPTLFYFYLQTIFVFFYFLRGDLMSSFALMITIVVLNIIIIKVLYKFEKTYEETESNDGSRNPSRNN